MTLLNSNAHNALINPIDSFIKEVKRYRCEAKKLGQQGIFNLCADMLDVITLFRADSDRLDKLDELGLLKVEDVRAFLDAQIAGGNN